MYLAGMECDSASHSVIFFMNLEFPKNFNC